MSDNSTLNPGTAGDVVRAIDHSGVKTQVVQLDIGGESAESLVTIDNPLPVAIISGGGGGSSGGLTDTELRASPVQVFYPGSLAITAASLPLPTGASTETTLAAVNTKLAGSLAVTGTFFQATQPISSVSLPLPTGASTETTLAAVNTKLAGSLAVTGTFFQATQPVSAASLPLPTGASTETTLAAVNTKLAGSLAVTGTFFQTTQPVSAAALPLPTGASTETTLAAVNTKTPSLGSAVSASSVPVVIASDQAAVAVTTPADVIITGQGSQTAANNNIVLASAGTGATDALAYRQVCIQIIQSAGTVTAGVVTFEGSNDNTNFQAIPLYDVNSLTTNPATTVTLVAATNKQFAGPLLFRYFRARISTGVTGTNTGVQAVTFFRTTPFYSPQLAVTQATGANLNVAVASGTVTTVSTVTSVSSMTPVTPTTTSVVAAASNNLNFAKASAGTIWSIIGFNYTASIKYLKIYNKASAPVVASDVPIMCIAIPANGHAVVEGGSNGFRFATGIAYAATGAQGDTDATNLAAGDIKFSITYT